LHRNVICIFHRGKISERKGPERSACFVKKTEHFALAIHNGDDE
jgi:hypothetical protein